ncbi:MAG TPA: hypothetical protein VFA11_04990 [Acidimicrobiales bacterium]|nr:hypothetical protein [Acidimicrobiales bacterium]
MSGGQVGVALSLPSRPGEGVRSGWSPEAGPELEVDPVRSDELHPEESPLPVGGPARVSAGIAFELSGAVEGPGSGPGDVMAATLGVAPALMVEVEGGPRRLVVSPNISRPEGIDLGLVGVLVEHDGVQVATAAGAGAPLGHPAAAVAGAARALAAQGGRLGEGFVVFSGALAPPVAAGPGSNVRATFAWLGSVGVRLL